MKVFLKNWSKDLIGVYTQRSFILNLLSQLFTKCLYFKSVFSPALKIMIFEEISENTPVISTRAFAPCFIACTIFFIRKPFFCLNLNFLNIILEIFWDFLNISLNCYFFIFFTCLLRFNTNNKRHFLTYVLTRVSNYKQPT